MYLNHSLSKIKMEMKSKIEVTEQGGPGPPNFLNTDVFIIDDSKTKKKLEKS